MRHTFWLWAEEVVEIPALSCSSPPWCRSVEHDHLPPPIFPCLSHLSFAPKERQTLLFSATLPKWVNKVARRFQENPLLVGCWRCLLPVHAVRCKGWKCPLACRIASCWLPGWKAEALPRTASLNMPTMLWLAAPLAASSLPPVSHVLLLPAPLLCRLTWWARRTQAGWQTRSGSL